MQLGTHDLQLSLRDMQLTHHCKPHSAKPQEVMLHTDTVGMPEAAGSGASSSATADNPGPLCP